MKIDEKKLINRNGFWLYLLRGYRAYRSHNANFFDEVNYFDGNHDIVLANSISDNRSNAVYLIYENTSSAGFFASIQAILDKLIYADMFELTPYICLGKGWAYYDAGKDDNPWNNYFDQVGNPSLIDTADRVIKQTRGHVSYVKSMFDGDEYRDRCSEIIKKYVHIKKEIRDIFDRDYMDMFSSARTLGVHFRGSDFKVGYKAHPTFVTLEQTVDAVDDLMRSGNYDKVFLATDDLEAIDTMKNKFGDKVVYFVDVSRTDGKVSVAYMKDDAPLHKYNIGLEVLRDCYFLGRCDALVGGLSNVSKFARLFKTSRDEEYDELRILDNGINKTGEDWK